jgi:protocatechuate 3,4-dioxygenase beta subunit
MPQDSPISRRGLLGAGAGAAAGFLAQRLGAEVPPGPACVEATAEQTSGPYYPTHDRADEDPDLTRVKGRNGRAKGEVLVVRGRILDEACKPVAGALVEIWQANTHGRYDHEKDAGNPRPLDPNFQSWAEMPTDAEGRFRFTTIKPGSYPVGEDGWIRPPHIHFRVSRRGYHDLVTQMYFDGETLNEADRIRNELSAADQAAVTVAFEPGSEAAEPGARIGVFDIRLKQVG